MYNLERIFAEFINNRPIINVTNAVRNANSIFENIFAGNELVNSLNVTGSVVTSKINDKDLNNVLDVNNIGTFILRDDVSIENIEIEKMINELNFSKIVQDSVLKTDNHVIIKGPKK